METRTDEEGVFTVYKGTELVAVVKRDEASRKTLVYAVKEMGAEEIINLIKQ